MDSEAIINKFIYKLQISNSIKHVSWPIFQNKIYKMWEFSMGSNIAVMVIDVKFYKHKDLNDNLIQNNFIDIPSIYTFGHGTAVCGVIGSNNKKILTGIAPESKIIPFELHPNKLDISLNEALKYAIDTKPDIVNISGSSKHKLSNKNFKLLNELFKLGIPVVCSSGNNMNTAPTYPASYNTVFSIGSYSNKYKLSKFSIGKENINFLMPGEFILTTSGKDSYSFVHGTSYSAAIFSGILCLILSVYKNKNKKLTSLELLTLLRQVSTKNLIEGDNSTYGTICIDKLLEKLKIMV